MTPADPPRGERELQPVPGRHAAILGALRTRGQVRAVHLADELGVTHETIRKDLLTLESHGLLRRVHGGAMPIESFSYEPHITARTSMTAEKARIAAAAVDFLPPEGAVLIDSGTTTAALVAAIPAGSALLAVTNALPIALALLAHPQLTVHMLGGRVRNTTMASVDAWTLRELHEIRADVAFVGTMHPEHGAGFDLWVGGSLSTNPMLSKKMGVWIPLDEVAEGYRAMDERRAIKVYLDVAAGG